MSYCPKCPHVNNCVPPSGPQQRGGILFIGEAPGVSENKRLVPFIGKTGEEVDRHYLPLAGLRRLDVTFSNAISCLPDTPGGKLDPKKAQHIALLESCANHHLYPLIESMQPKLLVPLGSFACRAVYGEGFDLEIQHGIPRESEWGPTFPMFHPALGMHSPKQMLYIRTDWDRLRKYLRGVLPVRSDPYAGQEDYAEVTHVSEIQELDPDLQLACDTESSRGTPFCLTYSQSPGTGRLVRAERVDLLEALNRTLGHWNNAILFHNWLYDWSVVEAMALRVPHRRVIDTMAVVYHLGNLPQGLKALALRELGMSMESFEDVVVPHSSRVAREYLELASFEDWPKPEPEMVIEKGKWKVYKPQGLNTKLKRLFTDLRKDPTVDIFERWKKWESYHTMVEEWGGPFPQKDIAHVPFDQALFYACRDSDALGRLWTILKKMRTLVRRYSQEQWRERAEVTL